MAASGSPSPRSTAQLPAGQAAQAEPANKPPPPRRSRKKHMFLRFAWGMGFQAIGEPKRAKTLAEKIRLAKSAR